MDNERRNYALFVDLENCGGKVETLKDVIEKVKIRGDILLGKVYGYNERFANMKEVLLSNTFNVVPSLKWGYMQKNNLDIQLVIDAMEVAYTNDLIDCFCIVSGDSDYTPLVGKLKSMGKYVLGISRSEVASKLFINACTEFIFLETVSTPKRKIGKVASRSNNAPGSRQDLNSMIERILRDQASPEGFLFASELKKTVSRLMPDFHEKNYGYTSFGKLMKLLDTKFGTLIVEDDNNTLKISLKTEIQKIDSSGITKDNWKQVFEEKLQSFKEDGFSRVNPSIEIGRASCRERV